MPDLATQIRTYLDDTAAPVTFEEIFAKHAGVTPTRPPLAQLEPHSERTVDHHTVGPAES